MQCVNCGFENIPGQKACVRCQSLIDLAGVSVRPPRASGRSWRLVRAIRRRLLDVPTWLAERTARLLGRLLIGMVPGLEMILRGKKRQGALLLGAWCTLLLFTLLFAGSQAAEWLMNAAIGLHVASITWMLGPKFASTLVQYRLVIGLLIFLLVRFGGYGPVILLVHQFVYPLRLDNLEASDVLESGDVLLCEGAWTSSRELEVGEVVAYHIADQTGPGYYIREGYGVDRVVGLPGDNVALKRGALTVNGASLEEGHAPLGDVSRFPDFFLEVPEGSVAIVPSLHRMQVPERTEFDPFMPQLVRVRREEVGRVWWRMRPLTRIGKLEEY